MEARESDIIINSQNSIALKIKKEERVSQLNRDSTFREPSVFEFSEKSGKPFPDPPLAVFNVARAPVLKNIDDENWKEGTDTKMRAYTWLRTEKEKMFEQNKEWSKFRGVFRGLHRVHERAKRPNKITEYDIPVNNVVKLKQYKTD